MRLFRRTHWHVGDIALIRSLPDIPPDLREREVTVMSEAVELQGHKGPYHRIDIQGITPRPGCSYYAPPHALKPLPPPDTKTTWAAGVWRPKGCVVDLDRLLETTE